MKAGRIAGYAVLTVYAVISVYPFLWMVSGAVKTREEVREGGHLIPRLPTWETLVTTWNQLHFVEYFRNSLVVTGLTVLGVLVVYSLASYAFAVLDFPGRRALFWFFVSLLFVPGITMLLPVVMLEKNLGILGSHIGLVLPFVNGTAPLSVLLLTGAYRSIPKELREAARADGAREARIFWSVYLPLARPAHITIAVLTAVPTWNEYVLTRVSINDPSLYTLPLGLEKLISSQVPRYNEVMAASLIIVLPVIALFLFLQRYFVNGLLGAIKG